jgi:hypothetical protein
VPSTRIEPTTGARFTLRWLSLNKCLVQTRSAIPEREIKTKSRDRRLCYLMADLRFVRFFSVEESFVY